MNFKVKITIIFSLIIFFGIFGQMENVGATEFFSDSFESGDLSHIENLTSWGGTTYASVVSGEAHTGSHAVQMSFQAAVDGDDSTSELFFDFGTGQTDVYIQYFIKFPSNYLHRTQELGGENNKFIRLWKDVYSDSGQIGASAWPDNISAIGAEAQQWGCGNGIGQGALENLWTLAGNDLNKWLRFEWRFKPDTGTGNGAISFWVDGDLKFAYNNLNLCDAAYLQHGYLMGWANSGFLEQTNIYIDDVVFSDEYIGLTGGELDIVAPISPSGLLVM